MAINAGDAIFNFLGDTTQLDQAWSKVEADANSKAPNVQQQINGVGDSWTQTGQAAEAAAQKSTQAAEQMGAAAQASAETSGQAAQAASPEWLALASATDAATRATIEHEAAQKELQQAIASAVSTQQGDQAALNALATAEEKVATTAAALAAAQKEVEIASQAATAGMRAEAEAAAQQQIALKDAAVASLTFAADTRVAAESADVAATSHGGLRAQIGLIDNTIRGAHGAAIADLIRMNQGLAAVMDLLPIAATAFTFVVLGQIIVDVSEKMAQLVSDTFIYTDEMKAEYAAAVELNKVLAEQATTVETLRKAYDLIGLEGAAKTRKEFEKLTEEVNKNEEALRLAENTLAKYRLEQQSVDFSAVHSISKEEADKAASEILRLTSLIKVQQEQQAALSKEFDKEDLAERIRHGEATISAEKTYAAARIELARAESDLRLTLAKAGYSTLIEAQQAFAEQQYQVNLKALRDTVAVLAQDPTRNQDRIKELNAQIEALEDQHQAKLIEIRVKGVQALQAAIKQALNLTQASPDSGEIIPVTEAGEELNQLTELMQQFGIKGSAIWVEQRISAEDAFDKIAKSGKATYTDLLQIQEKLLEAKIGEAISFGDQAQAEQLKSQLASVRQELDRLGVSLDKTHKKGQDWIDMWRRGVPQLSVVWRQMGQLGKDTLNGLMQAEQQAIASWILSEASLGEALRRGTAQVLAELAARAAIYALFYTAMGFAKLAEWDFTGAANAFHAAAIYAVTAGVAGAAAYAINPRSDNGGQTAGNENAQPIQTSAAAQTEAQPVQSTNVQRFAAGGLVFGPTLSILGDAANSASSAALSGPGQTEAALPLDDDRAMARIAQSLTKFMPPTQVKLVLKGASIKQLIREINHEVVNGNATLNASHAGAVRKKS